MAEKVVRELPKPGDLVLRDFRPKSGPVPTPSDGRLKLFQWNVERGYKLDLILEEVERLQPDILAIQEIDIGCDRSDGRDVGLELAERLQMNYGFVCEFEEIRSSMRSDRDQGGGVHGNGILTRFDMQEVRAIEHRHHPVDWENPALDKCKKEPRKGRRLSLAATIGTPHGDVVVYCCHLEVFCGISSRISQFADILRDSRECSAKGLHHQVIMGDLNTMANDFARFSPNFCCDHLRFRTLGQKEARFWKDNLLDVTEDVVKKQAEMNGGVLVNRNLRKWGLDEELCKEAVNPGFHDPWNVDKDVTLEHPAIKGYKFYLVSGKLDWILGKDVKFLEKEIGNHDYSMSDHKWLMAEVTLV